jgi:hypothetical protein
MRAPSADELAAIAAAFAIVIARSQAAEGPEASRWRLAARLPLPDAQRARFAARSASRWSAAGRLDG